MFNPAKSISKIAIPEPCHQPWNTMTDSQNGRFCRSCSKTVIDFTAMTDQQIIEHLSTAKHVCGRFNENQFSTINRQLQLDNLQSGTFWKRMLLALTMLTSAQYLKAQNTQTKPTIEQTPTNFKLGEVAIAAKDSTYHTLTGSITDAADKSVLPGVTIRLDGTNIGTQTNAEGKFTLQVPASATRLVISFIGYSSQSIPIDPKSDPNMVVALKMSATMLGEVAIVRPPFFKRVYYRFIKRPIRRIFG